MEQKEIAQSTSKRRATGLGGALAALGEVGALYQYERLLVALMFILPNYFSIKLRTHNPVVNKNTITIHLSNDKFAQLIFHCGRIFP